MKASESHRILFSGVFLYLGDVLRVARSHHRPVRYNKEKTYEALCNVDGSAGLDGRRFRRDGSGFR
jgi:hypothetical protein